MLFQAAELRGNPALLRINDQYRDSEPPKGVQNDILSDIFANT